MTLKNPRRIIELLDVDDYSSPEPKCPMRALFFAIITRAVLDYCGDNDEQRLDAEHFFYGPVFSAYCDLLDIDLCYAMRVIQSGGMML